MYWLIFFSQENGSKSAKVWFGAEVEVLVLKEDEEKKGKNCLSLILSSRHSREATRAYLTRGMMSV